MERSWTTGSIPDLSGNVAVVTGATSGIGFETARELAANGARVVLACRDARRTVVALESIRSEIPGAAVEGRSLDLASLESVRRLAESLRADFGRLDLLVNNAGVMLVPYGVTEDGFETHFGINHLGHFALTGRLVDLLLAAPGSRVVTVTSLAHRAGRLDFDDLMFGGERRYTPFRAYAQSKLASLLFAQELHRRLTGTDTISVSAHPGGAATDLGRRATERGLYGRLLPLLEWVSQSAAKGARSTLQAATDPHVSGGELIGPRGRLGMRGAPTTVRPSPRALDREAARRLWDVSETLTGVGFGLP